ncbi:MAG: tetratricopeptide repeat protein [Gammaproteobacteria bacterium]|nr:tetratricopeptide repeat protein [Gammaproteobacteria bacterium]
MTMAIKFNPNFQTDDESIANFIVRHYEFETVIEALTSAIDSCTDSPHFFISAPRGAGKTTLCRRIVAETRKSPILHEAWHAILLSEESYMVTTPGEFLLECLFQLKDQVTSKQFSYDYTKAIKAQSEEELIQLTLGSLRNFVKTTGKRLLIVVENFQTILNEQIQNSKSDGAKGLLTTLDDGSLFSVLATSVTHIVDDNITTIPQHYHSMELAPLSLDECRVLWESLTDIQIKGEKLRPILILTGGNPRLLNVLAEFTRTPSLHDLMRNLNYLIDQNTEYFKSQLDALSTIERKVFTTLLGMWDPRTARQVAEAARVNTNTASALLARLTNRGAVIKELSQGRTAIYIVAERLFNIYYLMRRHNHPSSRVRALVSFMMAYYDSDELVDTTVSLVREACNIEPTKRGDYHSTFDVIMSHSSETVRTQILAKTSPEFIESLREDQYATRDGASYLLREPSGFDDNATIEALFEKIEKAIDDDDLDSACDLIMEGIQINGKMFQLWRWLSFLELQRGNIAAAIETGEKACEFGPEDPWSYAILGRSLALVGRTEEAEVNFVTAMEMDPGQPLALTELASIREGRGDVEAALRLFEVAQISQALTDHTRYSYGQLLNRVGRKSEAEIILREGADEIDNELCRHALVEFLEANGRQNDGIQFLQTIAESHTRWETWADFGRYLVSRTQLFHVAQDALRKAIDMGGDEPSLYAHLAKAIAESGGEEVSVVAVATELVARFPDLSQAWTTAGQIYEALPDEVEAEAAYRKALEYDGGESALIPLAKLLQKQESRRSEAQQMLRKAVASVEGLRKCYPCRELAEVLIHDGDDDQATEVIEVGLQANESCVCCLTLYGDVCRRKGKTSIAEKQYRVALEVDSTAVSALTGLAQLVSADESVELIERAITANPEDPRVLLARARLNPSDPDAQVEDAEAALNLDTDFLEARLFLASLEANRDNLQGAISHLEAVLTGLPSQRELIPSFVNAAMLTVELDKGACLDNLLDRHENAIAVEPLGVAVKLLRGEKPVVAKEVKDVAWDIIQRTLTRSNI